MAREHYLFITGRIAEAALRHVVGELGPAAGFDGSIAVMPISVAALMTPKWIAKRLEVPPGATRVMIPGACLGELEPLEGAVRLPVERGPRDLRQLPDFFGRQPDLGDYGEHDVEILAKIGHAARWTVPELVARAGKLVKDGADVLVLGTDGTDPRETWKGVAQAVRALRAEGCRVAIESQATREIAAAVRAGAELVLAVSASNREAAADWGCEVVAVPDVPGSLDGLDQTIETLDRAGVPFRIDPGLSPIGFGVAESLGRYVEARRRWPGVAMLLAAGAVTESTEVDSAAIHVLLLGFCQELGIRSIQTTQHANWTRSAVRECDLARRLAYYAVRRRVLPRQVEPRLRMLRDATVLEYGPEGLARLAAALEDPSYRIFAEGGKLHVISVGLHLEGTDPFDVFEQLMPQATKPIDVPYAFYLGYEMAKAMTALTLGKTYRQEEALDWGMLTIRELSRMERRALRMARRRKDAGCDEEESGG